MKKITTLLNHAFNNPFITVTSALTQSTAVGAKTFLIPITIPQGYKVLAVAGFDVGYAECSVNSVRWDAENDCVRVQLRNNHTATLSVKVTVYVLCVKLGGVVNKLLNLLAPERGWAI